MIIFSLDGTLADCEHRRHFVDAHKNLDYHWNCYDPLSGNNLLQNWGWWNKQTPPNKFKPDWKAFYETCDKDLPIQPTCDVFRQLLLRWPEDKIDIQIWSGRCESVRAKTNTWLLMNITTDINIFKNLKMRPIGDNTPDDQLKERWLDEYLGVGKYKSSKPYATDRNHNSVDFVFDSDPKSIAMWRRRGIFVFDVNQGKEF